jgi:putative membrane protein
VVWGGIAVAQAAAAKSKTASHPAAHTFMAKVTQANLAEVEMGKLGAERGQSADVKKFAQQMVDDHTKANQELQDLAQKEGATLPTYTDKAHQAAKARIEKLSGDAFDRAFAAQMVKDHQAAVTLFRTQARSGQDPEVKAWAAKTLPTIEEHLKEAQALPGSKQASR